MKPGTAANQQQQQSSHASMETNALCRSDKETSPTRGTWKLATNVPENTRGSATQREVAWPAATVTSTKAKSPHQVKKVKAKARNKASAYSTNDIDNFF